MDYTLIKNNSKIYYNGSIWQSKTSGKFKIIGRVNKLSSRNNYEYYLIEFEHMNFKKIVHVGAIRIREVKNPYYPTVCGIGFIGEGSWNPSLNRIPTKLYRTWYNMLYRCYSKKSPDYNTYGAKGIIVCNRWHNFQNFCEDISNMENYNNWKYDNSGYWNIDKDINVRDLKIYSPKNCSIITMQENQNEKNKRTKITGLIYIAKHDDGRLVEFTNQHEFARQYDINVSGVNNSIKNRISKYKGWKFCIKGENDFLYPYVKIYIAERMSDNYKEEFTSQKEFAKKWNLLSSKISRCINGKAKKHKGWTFRIKDDYEII